MRFLRDPQAILTVLCALALVAGFVFPDSVIPYLSVAFGSVFALQSAYKAIKARELDVNLLMVLAAIGAVIVKRPLDAAALLFLFSLSNTLESFAMSKTRSAIEGLIKLRPDKAMRVSPEGDVSVPVQELKVGDQVRVAGFESIPSDGRIVQGNTSVNQAAMTGESVPVQVGIGSTVLAGTQNLEGMFVMEVTAEVGSSTLDKVVDLVRDAQENKASGERISTWFGERYTIFVLSVFVLAFVVRLVLKQPFYDALYGALVLLVALSPCALVISTPASTLSALAWAGRRGILIRGGEFLERLGQVTVAALDKTGTLTRGKPQLIEICVCGPATVPSMSEVCLDPHACWHGDGDMSDESKRMLRAAAAAEQYSTHPIAEAIVLAARRSGVEVPEALEQHDHSGLGVTARIDAGTVKIGQPRFFDNLPEEFEGHAEKLRRQGMTVAIMEFEGRFAALGLRDEPREEAAEVLAALKKEGIQQITMITGDNELTAKTVADELDIKDVRAGLMPQDKTAFIAQLEDNGQRVMMVGDGINDAPSLSRASVGVAMGGLGSDVALNAADIVLMQDRLGQLPELVRLGRKTTGVIRVNLFFAASVILGLTISSLFYKLPLPLAVVGHEGSTVLVILNGLRLLKGP
jgi:Cd2+/Zn2+-exporting ATPase